MDFELFHAGLGWQATTIILAVSFASSFITVSFGIGGGMIMLAVLAILLPAPAIIPVHGLIQLGSNIGRAAIMRPHLHLPVVLPFGLGALAGTALGGAFVVQLSAGMIQIGVGCFVLWSIIARPPAFIRHTAIVAGAFSSFLTMFFGGTGPFVAAFVKAQELHRHAFVATHATLMVMQHFLKTVAFGLVGFAFAKWLGLIGLVILVGFCGTLAGSRVLARINEKHFKIALSIILAALAIHLIFSGLTEMMATDQLPSPQ